MDSAAERLIIAMASFKIANILIYSLLQIDESSTSGLVKVCMYGASDSIRSLVCQIGRYFGHSRIVDFSYGDSLDHVVLKVKQTVHS